jgi:membrane protease YdiL (CAAX protease family)
LAQPSQQHFQPDPDDPPWGPVTGFSVWLASVAAIIVIPVIAVGIWLAVQAARGVPLPNFAIRSEVEQWALSPNILLLQIVATMVAHAITMAIFWAVVTRLGSRPFWASLGWSWGGHRVWYWVVFSICILLAIQIISQILTRFLPQEESPFDQMLKSSRQVRIAVAFLAVFTAPLVEEVVYRGVLFSSLRKRIGLVATVLVVTVMFAGVHVFQNRGAWVSIAGLAFLSLVLTIVRARTRSLLPCVFIHTLNNAFASVIIVLNKAS